MKYKNCLIRYQEIHYIQCHLRYAVLSKTKSYYYSIKSMTYCNKTKK